MRAQRVLRDMRVRVCFDAAARRVVYKRAPFALPLMFSRLFCRHA